jgi:dihydrofolate reductase
MGTLKVHEFMTLDGCIGAPMWTFEYPFTDQMSASVGALTGSSQVILLGRTTWEQTGPAWSSRTEEEMPGSDFFNNTAKWVVSSTLHDASSWRNSTVVGGYDADALRKLKDTVDGGIYCYGSGTLQFGPV